jgi:5-methylcytosine-specific restriction protein A
MPMQQVALEELTKYSRGTEQLRWKPLKSERGNHPAFTHGYYAVYLFHANEPVVHLSLNRGTTSVREEFEGRAREILRDRADLMRKRVADFADALPIKTIDLGSNARLPGDYVAGHALGTTYMLSALPDETQLRSDLQAIVRAYRALTYRGGIDSDVEGQTDLADEFGIPTQTSITETRRYACWTGRSATLSPLRLVLCLKVGSST